MAVLRNNPGGLKVVGNKDKSLSPYRKSWVKTGNILVVGAIGAGTSRVLTANWDSPFEDANAGSTFQKTAAIGQQFTGMTLITDFNSEQIWNGNQPHTIPLELRLYALVDSETEVTQAIAALETIASPDLNSTSPIFEERSDGALLGSPPGTIDVNVGRNFIYQNLVVESVDSPIGGPTDRRGHLTHVDITLNIQTKSVINRNEINSTFA